MGSNPVICALSESNSGDSVEVLVWKRRNKGRPIKIFLEWPHFALPRSEVKENKFLLPNEKKHTSFFREYKLFSCNKSCCCSAANLCLTLCNTMTSLSFTISWSLLKLMSIELVMPSNHLVLCYPLLLLSPIFPSIRVFSNESALCIVAKVLELQLQHQSTPSNEYSGLISLGLTGLISLVSKGLS